MLVYLHSREAITRISEATDRNAGSGIRNTFNYCNMFTLRRSALRTAPGLTSDVSNSSYDARSKSILGELGWFNPLTQWFKDRIYSILVLFLS